MALGNETCDDGEWRKLKYADYSLGGLYLLLIVLVSYKLYKLWVWRWSAFSVLYGELLAFSLARLIEMFIPLCDWYDMNKIGGSELIKEAILDLAFEFSFIAIYVLLICMWIEEVIKATGKTHSKRTFWLAYCCTIGVLFALMVVFCWADVSLLGGAKDKTRFSRQIRGIYSCGVTALIMITVMVTGLALNYRVSQWKGLNAVKTKRKKLLVMVLVIFITLAGRGIWYAFYYDAALESGAQNVTVALWFFFYLFSEVIPIALIIVIYTRTPKDTFNQFVSEGGVFVTKSSSYDTFEPHTPASSYYVSESDSEEIYLDKK